MLQGHEHPLLLNPVVRAGELSWVAEPPRVGQRLAAKTRYRQQDAACVIESLDAESLALRFDEPQWAVTPGQSVVLYDGAICLGGGVIV